MVMVILILRLYYRSWREWEVDDCEADEDHPRPGLHRPRVPHVPPHRLRQHLHSHPHPHPRSQVTQPSALPPERGVLRLLALLLLSSPPLIYFILFYFILFILFCFVLFCFVLFCFVLFCFVLFCFVLFCFVLFCFVLFCFVLFCFLFFSCSSLFLLFCL